MSSLLIAIICLNGVLVILVILSIWVENSGLLKAGPRQAEFEPIQAKTYKFSDVHGVDEAKAVSKTTLVLTFVKWLPVFRSFKKWSSS